MKQSSCCNANNNGLLRSNRSLQPIQSNPNSIKTTNELDEQLLGHLYVTDECTQTLYSLYSYTVPRRIRVNWFCAISACRELPSVKFLYIFLYTLKNIYRKMHFHLFYVLKGLTPHNHLTLMACC